MCFTLRLHMSAAPSRGGLTQALGGEKRFVVVPPALAIYRLRLAVLFGQIPARCRFVQVRKARSQSARVAFTGFGFCVFFRSVSRLHMLSLLTGPAESSRGAPRHSGFGLSAS